jgi:hypothetical protein
MSDSENFLARWSRLKRESAVEVSGVGESSPPAFDPASLPSIELIDAATDIRPFLEACVPEDLARAALRSTWSADPAIRDFIGIAESQWDFNDPASIPGFGAHVAADYLSSLAAHSIGSLNTAVGTPAQSTDPATHDPTDPPCQVAAALPERSEDAAVGAPEIDPEPPTVRSHGGALPR